MALLAEAPERGAPRRSGVPRLSPPHHGEPDLPSMLAPCGNIVSEWYLVGSAWDYYSNDLDMARWM